MKKSNKKQIKKSLDLKKLSREKAKKCMLNGKATIIHLTVGLIKKYISKPRPLGMNVKAELDLSNCATKVDLKNATDVNILDFGKKTNLTNLKSDVEKIRY